MRNKYLRSPLLNFPSMPFYIAPYLEKQIISPSTPDGGLLNIKQIYNVSLGRKCVLYLPQHKLNSVIKLVMVLAEDLHK